MTLAGWYVSVDVGRGEAQREAARELAQARYRAAQPPLLYRLLGDLVRYLSHLILAAAQHAPGGRAGLGLLLGLLLLAAGVAAVRLGPLRRDHRPPVRSSEDLRTAAEYRAAADAAAAAGRWADAVRESFRALATELEERGVLDRRAGRTADEVAVDAAAATPGLARDLALAARAFDDIWYGGRPADSSSYDLVRRGDDAARKSLARAG